ncbi:phosphate acetyltransferase [Sporanaerobium hydrogeniformans]|uniref:Phosphate acetyltransferase n=1 Tax=Sporanaerobium hydrogeniformans TaxID=3072179 RepID=A0AC61DEI0_9FIRM|nr:phosphate acetyltransferase [Sporanaerobium hydrogeniformans]PHV71106.1 phosphate acetyltransferase [Sporanaerobium hydrogeniformans]
MSFIEDIKARAKSNKKTIVLPETTDIRTLKAAHLVLQEEIANVILIGDAAEIQDKAEGLDLSQAEIINPKTFEEMDTYITELVKLREKKGMTIEKANQLLHNDPLFLGVMMVKQGKADGMVAGAINATADVLRPSLQILKTAPNTKLVSAFFVMVVPDCDMGANGTFIFSDAGLNQNPNSEELAAIAQSSAKSFSQLVGQEPVVAMLSHSTYGSAKHADVDKVVEATRIAKMEAPDLKVDGELQLDAAIVASVGKAKAPSSSVAGQANVLIFPDLDAGNIGYKLVQRLAKAEAYGPITQGIAKPVNDLSRGCSAEDIVGVVAITAVQAQ